MATWISIGTFADVDPTEGNFLSENASLLLGTYDSADMSFVEATANDINGDGIIWENDLGGGETITIDGVTTGFDSVQTYTAIVTLGDGSRFKASVGVVQLTNGETYILPTDETHLDSLNIQSIELVEVGVANFDGMHAKSAARSIDDSRIVCFASGTLIETDHGNEPIETLVPGRMVRTMDRGFQPLRWIESFRHRTKEATRPILIGKSALGRGVPHQDLMVSPQHRILVNSKIALRVFNAEQVLIPAKKLVGAPGIRVTAEVNEVTYWHVLFDHHEIIFANGAPTESLYLGPMATDAIPDDVLARAQSCLRLAEVEQARPTPARRFARGKAQIEFTRRHIKNRKAFLDVEAREFGRDA